MPSSGKRQLARFEEPFLELHTKTKIDQTDRAELGSETKNSSDVAPDMFIKGLLNSQSFLSNLLFIDILNTKYLISKGSGGVYTFMKRNISLLGKKTLHCFIDKNM